MSLDARSLRIPAVRGAPWPRIVAAAVVALALTATMTLVDRSDEVGTTTSVNRGAYQTVVTGTGPGLAQIAGARLDAYRGSTVTGTGPGLARFARSSLGAYRGSTVTGTGPGLAAFAGSNVSSVASRGLGPSRIRE